MEEDGIRRLKELGVDVVSVGKIKKVFVPCPCCSTVYKVPLRNDYKSGVLVTMDTYFDGYFPTIRMTCGRCGVYFTHVVSEEGGNDVST